MGERLKDRVGILFGAGSVGPGWGNGKASAVAYGREGARAACVDARLAAAEETAGLIVEAGGRALALAADVTDSDAVQAAVEACVGEWGVIDVLHNNVGIAQLGGPVELPLDAWRRMLDVNVTGMFLGCKHAIPVLLAGGGGVITNISSVAAVRYTGYAAVGYGASKSAITGLTLQVAMQYARQGIRCNAIQPGLMDTPMIREPLKDAYGEGGIERMIEARNALTPTGQMGTGWDVAHLAVFLATDEAHYLNGAFLTVDGGLSVR